MTHDGLTHFTHENTYDVIKLLVFPQSSLRRNMNSAGWALILTPGETFFNTVATEPMQAFRIYMCISKRVQTDGTLEIVPHQILEQIHNRSWTAVRSHYVSSVSG